MKRKRGKPDVSFEVDLNLVNAGALVGQGRLQVLPSVGYTQLGPQSLSYSSEGVVAAVFSADKSGTDAIVFMDAIADPLGEPLAAMNTIAILESETATSEGTYGRERATPTDNLSKSIYSNGFREHVKEVSWGPVIGIQEGLEVTPLALVTVSGKAGLLLVQRKSRSILLEAKPTFLRVSGHATAVSWRPLTIPLPAKDRVADDPKIQTLLATGTLAGSISIWLVRNVPVSDNGPKRVARLTTITPPGHVPSTDHRKPRGDAVVAMDWVATEVGILWDNLVVLRGRGRVEIWSCTVRESDDDTQPEATLDHSLNLEPPRMAPVSCLKIQALSLNDKLHVVVPYDLDLVLFVVDEEGALLDPVRTRTNHTKPITGIAATAHWIATCAHDGKILLYPFGGEVLANLGCSVDGAGVRKPPQLSSIEVANTLPATPHSLAFSPTGTVLLVYKVISQRETPMQRPKCTHNLLPIYISSAAKPAHQLALMLKAPTIGKASEAATFGAGGILSSVWACCHSSELRGSGGVDWFSAVQVALHKYMQRRELRHPSVAELLTPLRLASALIHYVPPWASASHPVTPDPAYPATQPSASASVIRTEILKVCARASLRYLILHPPASFPLQEMESALTMASLLASSAARAVALWTHGLSQEEESRLGASEGMTKEQKIQAKLKVRVLSCSHSSLPASGTIRGESIWRHSPRCHQVAVLSRKGGG
ncbi:hypothetical protein DIPPA_12566 [Diplonema papillatum]|nr:hypothetical protein DIPPA_12566 [Diplonema papillatum]